MAACRSAPRRSPVDPAFVTTPGIFRQCGCRTDIDEIRARYNAGAFVDLRKYSVFTICDAMKLFLRQLKDRLVTAENVAAPRSPAGRHAPCDDRSRPRVSPPALGPEFDDARVHNYRRILALTPESPARV